MEVKTKKMGFSWAVALQTGFTASPWSMSTMILFFMKIAKRKRQVVVSDQLL